MVVTGDGAVKAVVQTYFKPLPLTLRLLALILVYGPSQILAKTLPL